MKQIHFPWTQGQNMVAIRVTRERDGDEATDAIEVPRRLKTNRALCTIGSTVERGERERKERWRDKRGSTRPSRYTLPYSGLYMHPSRGE